MRALFVYQHNSLTFFSLFAFANVCDDHYNAGKLTMASGTNSEAISVTQSDIDDRAAFVAHLAMEVMKIRTRDISMIIFYYCMLELPQQWHSYFNSY